MLSFQLVKCHLAQIKQGTYAKLLPCENDFREISTSMQELYLFDRLFACVLFGWVILKHFIGLPFYGMIGVD